MRAPPPDEDRPVEEPEAGYALVAAVVGLALFAGIAVTALTATRAQIETGRGEILRAKALAAADAGIAITLHDLVSRDPAAIDALDGRTRVLSYEAAELSARIVDEKGKIPLNAIDDATVTRLFEQLGLQGEALETARDSLLDWIDDDEDVRPMGAETAYYAPFGIAPRNSGLQSLGELARIRGIGPVLAARMAPFVSVDPDALSFDPAHADPRAIAVMTEGGADSVAAIAAAREQAGQRTALGFGDARALVGRPLTIAVDAVLSGGGRAHREAQVIITANAAHPFLIRAWH
ncbi:general secretion pathway protein GspK [Novosphingobium sp.]|uniref:general secretion pathway protein GspK n=1 Tax=Novosphingobium sp. TaxID=1874826 RepID=UPI0038BDFA87